MTTENLVAREKRWIERGGILSGALFLLALVVRLAYLWSSSDNPTFFAPVVDSETYDRLARAFAAGEGLSHEFFWQPFFYPSFLSLAYAVSGSSIVFVKVLQAIVGATTCVLTFRLGAAVFDRRAGLLAGTITALYGPLVFFDGELLSTVWAAFGAVALILLSLRAARSRRPWTFLALGLCGALAVVTRPTFLPFFVGSCVWLVVTVRKQTPRPRLRIVLVSILLGLVVVWVPVALLSRAHTGRTSIFPASAGINLFIGNNPDAARTMVIRPGSEWNELTNLPRRHGVVRKQDTGKFFLRRTAEYMRDDPAGFLRGLVLKTGHLLSSRELPRNVDPYVFGDYSVVLRVLLWKIGGFGLPFGLLLPLAAIGVLLCRERLPGPLVCFLLLYPLSIILVFGAARYRVPLVPALAVVAAGGCFALPAAIGARRVRRLLATAAVVVTLLLVATLPGPYPQERVNYRAEMSYALGTRSMNEGDLESAANHLRRAIRMRPEHSDAHNHLGLTFLKMNNQTLAMRHFEQAVQANPRSVTARKNLAGLLESRGRPEEALREFRAAVEHDPFDPDMLLRLGAALIRLERYGEAEPYLRRSLELRPDHPGTKSALVHVLRAQSR